MADVIIIFGSNSDSKVYDKIKLQLENDKVHDAKILVCSAHRSPDLIEAILKKENPKVIVAGAGLAAHLPGVIAANTIRPVIGVPVNSNFQGLDSLLAIVQMPPGIPVLTVGVDNAYEAAKYANLILEMRKKAESSNSDVITIIGEVKNEKVVKAIEILEKFGIKHEFSQEASSKNLNLHFGEAAEIRGLTINVPLVDGSKIENSMKLFEMMRKGLWVGVGRAENAAIAAVQILSIDGKYDSKLNAYKKEMRSKIVEGLKQHGYE